MKLEALHEFSPFALKRDIKRPILMSSFQDLSMHHYRSCVAYQRILEALSVDPGLPCEIEDLLFLPVRLFKEVELRSIPSDKVHKILTSSGTTGQRPSRIFLDQAASANQVKVLIKIVSDFLGAKRMPMLIVDCPSTLKNRQTFSAREAGALGFSILGTDITYALNEQMEIDHQKIDAFLERHQDQDIFIFGFTSIIWEYLHLSLVRGEARLPLERGILIHGGGWKKLTQHAVDNHRFKEALTKSCGIRRVHNYYGMVEQTGSIFMECDKGYFHTSNYSDVIIRNPDFSDAGFYKPGLVQLLSVLPMSYPGHSLLSEDVGQIFGEDSCSCGRFGKYFTISGRVENAEVRGCSDTFTR